MNALLTPIAPPLVVEIGRGTYAYIHHGTGHLLCVATGQWTPMVDVVGIGGSVLTSSQVLALVETYGRPT